MGWVTAVRIFQAVCPKKGVAVVTGSRLSPFFSVIMDALQPGTPLSPSHLLMNASVSGELCERDATTHKPSSCSVNSATHNKCFDRAILNENTYSGIVTQENPAERSVERTGRV